MQLSRQEITEQVKMYVATQILDNKSIGLDERTPLLEWGILNSLEIVRLLAFIQQQFDVVIPPDNIVADHFTNLQTISNLILQVAEDKEV